MNLLKYVSLIVTIIFIVSCGNSDGNKTIYNGRTESDIISISSQVLGTIDQVAIDEGDAVRKGELLFKINTDKTEAQLKSQQAQRLEIQANLAANKAQIRQVESQLKLAQETLQKTRKLVSEGAATQQQQDELDSKVEVLQAQKESLQTNTKMLDAKEKQLAAAMELTQISLDDARISAPIDGIILNRFVEQSELASPGRTLAELANLRKMKITIYISLSDLSKIKIGQNVNVKVDGQDKMMPGTIEWIASESEFTPKTILTKETRTTLVYAVKVAVDNPDGVLKIGMPVDVVL
jgi:HlyD family secretion protein